MIHAFPWRPVVLVLLFFPLSLSPTFSQVRINEFLASNGGGLLDADGDASDWIELHNPSDGAVDMEGWYLTDNASNLTRWQIPAVVMDPGAYLVVFASSKDRRDPAGELHTNFSLSREGEYLALVRPDGSTVAQEFAPAFPPQERNISYGVYQDVETLVAATAMARWHVPTVADDEADWQGSGLDDSEWPRDILPLRFGAAPQLGLIAHWPLDERDGAVAHDEAGGRHGTLINGPQWLPNDGAQDGALHFSGADQYIAVPDESAFDFSTAMTVACWIRVEAFDREWQAIVTKGDSAWRLHRHSANQSVSFDLSTAAGVQQVAGSANVNDGRWHHVAATFDGQMLRLFINGVQESQRAYTGFIAQNNHPVFIGENAELPGRGWRGAIDDVRLYDRALSAGAIQSMYSGQAGPNTVEGRMRGQNTSLWARIAFPVEDVAAYPSLSLRMRYEDGFVAWLNGTEVVRANAPDGLTWNASAASKRPAGLSGTYVTFPQIDATLLTTGTNTLAIQGLNVALDDGDFILGPELLSISEMTEYRYFTNPTPGEANTPGSLGLLAPPDFSVSRGFYDNPFELVLSSDEADAQIRYTLNGAAPTATTGLVYRAPIAISDTAIVRARAFKPGYEPSHPVSHTYLFLDSILTQPSAPPGFPTHWKNEPAKYAMNPAVVNHPAYRDSIRDDMQSLPVISIVMAQPDLFGAERGIYANTTNSGVEWERPGSVEIMYPDGSVEDFQGNCGVRIYGGVGRYPQFKKHSLRLLFKTIYGANKMEHPLFGPDAADRFDSVILRAQFNYSWHIHLAQENNQAQYLRDEWSRRTHHAMGQLSSHGTFVHLYLNGLYWGMYNVVERPNADFCSNYYGGEKPDWDVLNSYPRTIVDGTADTWLRAHEIATAGVRTAEGYAALSQYVDIVNLIDYMLVNFYSGNYDWDNHNWYAGRRREPGEGWKFFCWDSERSLWDIHGTDRTGISQALRPSGLYAALRQNPEFRLLFADRVQLHMFNNGALTPARTAARYRALSDHIYQAIVCESARWGDTQRQTPYTRNVEWVAERDRLLTQYFPQRTNVVLGFLRNARLYPQTRTPVISPRGGAHNEPVTVRLQNPNTGGKVYYTLDGSDPRLPSDMGVSVKELIPEDGPRRVLVPSVENGGDQIGVAWTGGQPFDDSQWRQGQGGVGYERTSGFEPYFQIDVGDEMYEKNATCYIRVPFTLTAEELSAVETLTLQARYADGLIAYLNGVRLLNTGNAPSFSRWDSSASSARNDADAIRLFSFDLSIFRDRLREGDNILAVHGLNASADSAKFLLSLRLVTSLAAAVHLSPGAQEYTGPFVLPHDAQLRTRAIVQDEWSAIDEARFVIQQPLNAIIITEFMADLDGPDALREWVELYNTTDAPINIEGWEIRDHGRDRHVIDNGGQPLWVPARGYLVLGGSTDPARNDGAPVDYAYGEEFVLGNNGDEIILLQNGQLIHSVGYGDYDLGEWTLVSIVPQKPTQGQATGMAGNYYDGPVDAWMDQVSRYGPTDARGTPGAKNDGVHVGPDADTEPPRLVEARFLRADRMLLTFDDLLLESVAGDVRAYRVDGDVGHPVEARLVSPVEVELRFPLPLTPLVEYTLTVTGLEDGFGNAMTEPEQAILILDIPSVTVSEFMYAPLGGPIHEYIELFNPDPDLAVDLSGAAFTDGVSFVFPEDVTIPPLGRLLVVQADPAEDFAAFRQRYGLGADTAIVGPWTGNLDNSGETVTLKSDSDGVEIFSFTYNDSRVWPEAADGVGHSLVPRDERRQPAGALSYPLAWRASVFIDGSPGSPDPAPLGDVWLNEIAAWGDSQAPLAAPGSWVELYNPTDRTVRLDRWYLSDDDGDLKKWPLPDVEIPARDWRVIDGQTAFAATSAAPFAVSPGGGALWLSHLPGIAGRDRVADAVRFKAQRPGTTLGRAPDGGPWWFHTAPTRGGAHGPVRPDLVLDEIMYHPPDDNGADNRDGEYVEIYNPTDAGVALWTEAGAWRLSGEVAYTFPAGMALPAGGRILVVGFNPADTATLSAFMTGYGIEPGQALILGPWQGSLSNSGGRIALERRLAVDDSGESLAWGIVDEAIYFHRRPFSSAPDGQGAALHRVAPLGSGWDPANWAPGPPTPGATRPLGGAAVWVAY